MATLSLSALALTGCAVQASSTSFAGEACDRGVNDTQLAELVTVSGDAGAAPEVTLASPLRFTELAYTELAAGDGTALTQPTQLAVVEISLYDGETGALVITTPYDGDLTRLSNIQGWAGQIPGLGQAMECAQPGARIIAGLSPDDVGTAAQQGLGISEESSVVAIIDVLKTYHPRAEGTLQYNDLQNLPTVVRGQTGQPGITVPNKTAPTELVTEVLIKGDGEPLAAGQSFRAHYTGVLWADNEIFDSSWEGGVPTQFSLDSLVPGVAQALEGQTVGSQVLVVVPPELGYGDTAQGTIPANSTLVFVFDILGIDGSPES